MLRTQVLVAALLLFAPLPAAAAPAASTSAQAEIRRMPFTSFGARPVLELRGDGASATLDFGLRADELVTRAVLHLRYEGSSAAARSHVRLTLNDQVVGLLPIAAEDGGRAVERALEIDPRLLVGDNRLVMTLVASGAAAGAAADRPEPWADVRGASELETGVRPLLLADELARLPEPFFDRRDHRRVTVPFAFAGNPSLPSIRAAAVVASWLGQLAAWRGTRFPVSLGEAPRGHAIVFATNGERPSFLAGLAPVDGPQLRLATSPADGTSKMLLVLGRDAGDLQAAAVALVLGQVPLSGAVTPIREAKAVPPRQPYDAPRWVRVDRAMTFGELREWPSQLEATGRPPRPDPVRLNLRVPPDLVAWRSPGVPMNLRYRYTPPPCARDSRLQVGINDELLDDIALVAPGAAATQPVAGEAAITVPAYRLRSRNELQFAFVFELRTDGACAGSRPGAARVAIDPESTIDFSGFPHYAEMPNLNQFAAVGFPFTRHADLSRTVVVLPERPLPQDIETLLALMGRMGEATGLPATGVRVSDGRDEAALADADLLVIGVPTRQALLARWSGRLPVALAGTTRRGGPSAAAVRFDGEGPVAALLGFESPLTGGRSVVALTAGAPDQLVSAVDAMEDRELRRAMRGGVVLVHPEKVESLRLVATYSMGYLPPWAGLWYRLSDYTPALAVAGIVALLVLAWAVWRWRRAVAAPRACAAS